MGHSAPLRRTGFGQRGFRPTPVEQVIKVSDSTCRGCGTEGRLDAAHTIPRHLCKEPKHPEAVIPLCRSCHQLHHAGKLDMLPLMTATEQARAVLNCGSIAFAYDILTGP